jgi:glutamine synthetase type III
LAKIEELQLQLGSKVDELQLQSQRLESRKRELHDQTQAIKQQMVNAFDELRQRLDKKERELMQNADAYLERNVIELESYMRLISGRCLTLN